VNRAKAFNSEVEDLKAMLDLVDEMGEDPEVGTYQQEVVDTIARLQPKLDQLELASFLSGPHDACNAFLTINSGAGGTESCDWADMLMRMYSRWAESSGFKAEVLDIQPGEEAGISSATLRIEGPQRIRLCQGGARRSPPRSY
jgi:peptide chain release factor 2